MHYLLIYEITPDYLEKRAQYRQAHLDLAWQAQARGELVLGGALGDPVDSAILLFKADSPQIVQAFAEKDPYVLQGLVKHWTIKPWMTVVGADAFHPIRAEAASPTRSL